MESETHAALLNDLVLENIFKYLGFRDLKSCRNVQNCQWLKTSNKAWYSCTAVTFKHDDETAAYLNQTGVTFNVATYRFLIVLKNLDDFCQKLGHSIEELEIFSISFSSVECFRNLLYTHCPNLKKLVIAQTYFKNTDVVEPEEWQEPEFGAHEKLEVLRLQIYPKLSVFLPLSWMEMLSHLPNLQTIDVHGETADVFRAISIIRRHEPEKLKLKHITVRCASTTDHEQYSRAVLLDDGLKLETIGIQPVYSKPELLTDIVNFHAKSLKKLFVFDCNVISQNFNGFPLKLLEIFPEEPLHELDTLKLDAYVIPVNIFKFIPNVRTLGLSFKVIKNFEECVDPTLKLTSCLELSLYDGCLKGASYLHSFINLCPNVEILKLECEVDNCTFSSICAGWTKLVSCALHRSEVDTSGLLGYDPNLEFENVVRKPNITGLKGLTSFYMGQDAKQVRVEMRNCDVILRELEGLQHMRMFKLKNYNLEGSTQSWQTLFAKYGARETVGQLGAEFFEKYIY